ncbi:MAG: GGDEF domain-containing protein [Myxococcales bacterium]|nr:GGDEF domain-containing protein [Myxococcales bacterium]
MASTNLASTETLPIEVLRRFALFSSVDDDALRALIAQCTVLTLTPEAQLLSSGVVNRHAYVLLSGTLRIHLGDVTSEPIAFVKPGEVVGELSVIDQRPTSAHVVASEVCQLLSLGERGFWQLVEMSHSFAVQLMHKLAERLRANNTAVVENTMLREQFEKAALYDALTSIHNRRWLDETLPRLLSRHRHANRPLSVGLIDVDHFKRFNDDHGHEAGDEVLKAVAKTLQDKLRPTDLVARYGGEEFVLILPDTDLPGAHCAAERLRKAVETTTVTTPSGDALPSVTISMGLSRMEAEHDPAQLLKACDQALYRAKDNGRNRIECAPTSASLALDPPGRITVDGV